MFLKSKLTATAAAIALVTPAAIAQSTMSDNNMGSMNSGYVSEDNMENLIRSSNLIGGTVYTATGEGYSGDDWMEVETFDAADNDWETIGTVEDIVMSRDGQMTGFVVEDAGFLGIGDDSVLIEMSNLRMIDDGSEDFHWVTNITEEQFESMEEVEENWF